MAKKGKHWMLETAAGRSLRDELLSNRLFKREPEMVIPAIKLLLWIAERTLTDDEGNGWGVKHKKMQNALRKPSTGRGASPAQFKQALIRLDLLLVIRRRVLPGPFSRGKVERYGVSDRVKDYWFLAAVEWAGQQDFSYSLCTGIDAAKRRRRRREALDLDNAYSKAHELLAASVEVNWAGLYSDNEKIGHAAALIGNLARVDYPKVENNGESSRLYHPLASFPSNHRRHLVADGKPYCAEVDIRACWPTFFAAQLLKEKQRRLDAKGGQLSWPWSGGQLEKECAAWQAMFCDPAKDPREIIQKEVGLKADISKTKMMLNKWLSGLLEKAREDKERKWELPADYVALDLWFSNRFPAMHKAWLAANPSKVGWEIGHNFETPLMADERLYKYADERVIMLCYQFDGFGVFALPMSEQELDDALAGLCALMRQISMERFGIPLVVVSERVV